jgi:hypothetical protein
MQKALGALDQIRDVVEAEAGAEVPQVARADGEPTDGAHRVQGGEPAPNRVVDDLAKRRAGPPRFATRRACVLYS